MIRAVLTGIAAGAAGTTALNAVTYLDMMVRARPASTTPDETVGTGPMAALGVTDVRTWPADSWVSDLVPHLAYGFATAAVWELMQPGRRRRRS